MSDSDFWGKPTSTIDDRQPLYCHHDQNRCVEDPFVEIVNKLPGHSCINNYECLSGKCEPLGSLNLTYCAGAKQNEECLSHVNCDVGLFCQESDEGSQRTCQKQKKKGDQCRNDYDCENYMACANKLCVNYGGMFNGQECDNALAC